MHFSFPFLKKSTNIANMYGYEIIICFYFLWILLFYQYFIYLNLFFFHVSKICVEHTFYTIGANLKLLKQAGQYKPIIYLLSEPVSPQDVSL